MEKESILNMDDKWHLKWVLFSVIIPILIPFFFIASFDYDSHKVETTFNFIPDSIYSKIVGESKCLDCKQNPFSPNVEDENYYFGPVIKKAPQNNQRNNIKKDYNLNLDAIAPPHF